MVRVIPYRSHPAKYCLVSSGSVYRERYETSNILPVDDPERAKFVEELEERIKNLKCKENLID